MKMLADMSKSDKKKLIEGQLKKYNKTLKSRQKEGLAYYESKNTEIMKRKKQFYNIAKKCTMTDYTKANNKLPSGFMNMLVKQKVNYSINRKIVIDPKVFESLTRTKFYKRLKSTATDASNQIYGVWQFWVEDNELRYKQVNPMSVIPIFSDMEDDKVDIVIRTYEENGVKVVEVWDSEEYETWHFKSNGNKNAEWCYIESKCHYSTDTSTSQGTLISTEDHNWGRPPFAFLFNNDELQTDLERVKNFIDLYDVVFSDFGNNFEDYQELYWVLKGYQGQDPAQFIEEFKKSRVLKVGEDGDATQEAQEVPADARDKCLELLRHDIYRFAMGVDPEAIKGDTTNVAIKASFYNLNLKANDFEIEIQDFMDQVIYFINEYYGETEMQEITFNRDMLINEVELLDANAKQMGSISEETRLANHPWVTNVDEEMENMDATFTIPEVVEDDG